jgi:hypothetical protein
MCRPKKGCEMRERTAVKVARFVPGRGGKSNLSFLFNKKLILNHYNKQVRILILHITNSSKKEQDFQRKNQRKILFNHFRFHNTTELKVKKYGFLKLDG